MPAVTTPTDCAVSASVIPWSLVSAVWYLTLPLQAAALGGNMDKVNNFLMQRLPFSYGPFAGGAQWRRMALLVVPATGGAPQRLN